MFSVYNADFFAVLQSLLYALANKGSKFLVCTDSLTTMEALSQLYSTHPLVCKIHNILSKLSLRQKVITFCWVPSHVGIPGNELADQRAKEACMKNTFDCNLIVATDLKACFKHSLNDKWRKEWYNIKNNKLREVKDCTSTWISSRRLSRREEVVLTRLRIGHTYLTQGYLLRGEDPSLCDVCGVTVTVKHILTECTKYKDERNLFKLKSTLREILTDDASLLTNVFKFLKSVKLTSFN
jgi:RNase H